MRYDAEGTSGIINIILKKDRRKGFNGSIDVSAGYPWQAGLGINTNYRLSKVNLFANYNINYRENIGSGSTYREVNGASASFITDQENERIRRGLSNTIRFGGEYFINPKNTLTLSLMYRYARQNNTATVTYNDFLSKDVLFNQSQRVDEQTEKEPNLEYALDYRKQFAKKDQLLTANVQYFNNSEQSASNITETVLFATEFPWADPILQETGNDEKESNLQAQVDYFHPFGGKPNWKPASSSRCGKSKTTIRCSIRTALDR